MFQGRQQGQLWLEASLEEAAAAQLRVRTASSGCGLGPGATLGKYPRAKATLVSCAAFFMMRGRTPGQAWPGKQSTG